MRVRMSMPSERVAHASDLVFRANTVVLGSSRMTCTPSLWLSWKFSHALNVLMDGLS
jgi:hypothetical protein